MNFLIMQIHPGYFKHLNLYFSLTVIWKNKPNYSAANFNISVFTEEQRKI
jgi:hypothetical protein